jgi:3-dehydroquinate synthetase
MLALVRKLIILDLGGGALGDLLTFAATILALGAVYWLVKDREARD